MRVIICFQRTFAARFSRGTADPVAVSPVGIDGGPGTFRRRGKFNLFVSERDGKTRRVPRAGFVTGVFRSSDRPVFYFYFFSTRRCRKKIHAECSGKKVILMEAPYFSLEFFRLFLFRYVSRPCFFPVSPRSRTFCL